MSDSDLFTFWYWSLAVAALVVLLAAALLVTILLVARRILNHARQALAAAELIAEETKVIWDLSATNRVAGEILASAESIEAHGGQLVEALHGPGG